MLLQERKKTLELQENESYDDPVEKGKVLN
jgi:hypothetical protein